MTPLFALLLLTPLISARPQQNAAESTAVEYSFFPEVTGDLRVSQTENGATVRGMFGLTDFSGYFVYGGLTIAALFIVANFMGISVFGTISKSVSEVAKRYEILKSLFHVNGIAKVNAKL